MIFKREPALIAAAVIAVLNLLVGKDVSMSQDVVETALLFLSGLFVRQRVSPVE
jgi:hypothetical protein